MIERIAFVSARGGSAFMAELLDVVADSVEDHGHCVVRHEGTIDEVDNGTTAFVVIPHEYFVVAGPPNEAALTRTVGFCVEHPGTATFETSHAAAARLAARFDINADSQAESRRRGRPSERYQLGYSRRWDRRADAGARDIDVAYLGTADPRRLGILARLAEPLRHTRAELLIPPHEPMTVTRPDFLLGAAKWQLLARSRILLNLHREAATAFEWVRALEAICNGAVVVSEPAGDLAPFVAGEHLLIARPDRLGPVLLAALADPDRLAALAADALSATHALLDPAGSAARLADVALSLPPGRVRAATPRRVASVTGAPAPLAEWVPAVRPLPGPQPLVAGARRLVQRLLDQVHELPAPGSVESFPSAGSAEVDVICVSCAGDGPVSLTLDCLPPAGVAVHLAFDGVAAPPLSRWPAVRSVARHDNPIGRARCRNQLLEFGTAPLVLVLDAGDELIGDSLAQLIASFTNDASTGYSGPVPDVALCMARLGTDRLVNILVPEERRLRRFHYLTRGYLVRRSWLERIGGFTSVRTLQGLADHDFWSRSAAAGVECLLQRRIGAALWPTPVTDEQAERELGAADDLDRALLAIATSPPSLTR